MHLKLQILNAYTCNPELQLRCNQTQLTALVIAHTVNILAHMTLVSSSPFSQLATPSQSKSMGMNISGEHCIPLPACSLCKHNIMTSDSMVLKFHIVPYVGML